MVNFFLRAKHWKVFLLLLGIPFLAQVFFFMLFFFDSIGPSDPFEVYDSFENLFRFMPWFVLLSMGGILAWFWSIGQGLQEKIPADIRLNTSRLAISIAYPLLYFFLFFQLLMPALLSISTEVGQLENPPWLANIIPMHLLAVFCMFYNMYFAAKTIKLAELKRPVRLGEFIGEIFLFWFFLIGIWFIQPRVNRRVDGRPDNWEDEILDM